MPPPPQPSPPSPQPPSTRPAQPSPPRQQAAAPTVLFVVGPPAVGKMTVGQHIADRTGFRMLHNHLTIEPVLQLFAFGSEPFNRLVEEFRNRLFEEAAACAELPGLISTFVWAFDLPGEGAAIDRYAKPFRRRGGRVLFLELQAEVEERLRRNTGASRLAAKPSKRDTESSRRNLLDADARHRLRSRDGEVAAHGEHLCLDTTLLTPDQAAARAVTHFDLPDAIAG